MAVMLALMCSEALKEDGTVAPDHPDALEIGPFTSVTVTYDCLRVYDEEGDTDQTVAFFDNGVWKFGVQSTEQGDGWRRVEVAEDHLTFSDFSVYTID
jgi:hypothetical protein